MRAFSEISGRTIRAAFHARPPPSRTPERRRLTSPETSFQERCMLPEPVKKPRELREERRDWYMPGFTAGTAVLQVAVLQVAVWQMNLPAAGTTSTLP
jgi:hypothetical protein